MRFLFKTSYAQDIRLYRHNGDLFWYGLLALFLIAAPFVLEEYYIGELSFVFIYAIVGIALMLLVGFTGQVSLGHAAFLGIGAYAHAYFLKHGVPWLLSVPLSGLITGAVGFAVGLPALRMTGIYLSIATLAFGEIIDQVFIRWESVTNGFRGQPVPKPEIFGFVFDDERSFYGLCLVLLIVVTLIAINLLRSPTGRAWVAIRDSEIAAQSMGVNLAVYKTTAFAVSAFLTGIGGALFAHKIGYLAPDIFTIILSIQLLLGVVVGGLGSLQGAFYGAIFVTSLPVLIANLRDGIAPAAHSLAKLLFLPDDVANGISASLDSFIHQPGLEPGLFGFILVLFILLEPLGIYGRWMKIKLYFSLFPLYKKATFRRQKAYMKSERLR
ncbi:MAG TPA: branched-chain amino acid ABC transporter permease [Candidatus Sulfotelmatobacter sp.]|nr:branched-chain amino acid ABC transporter permease [Candidatus Sulfotelmatobacter sp.]